MVTSILVALAVLGQFPIYPAPSSLTGTHVRVDTTRPVMMRGDRAVLSPPSPNPLWDTENSNLVCKVEMGGSLEVKIDLGHEVLVRYTPKREPVPASCCSSSSPAFWTTPQALVEMQANYERNLRESEDSRRRGGPPPLVLKR